MFFFAMFLQVTRIIFILGLICINNTHPGGRGGEGRGSIKLSQLQFALFKLACT